MVRGFGNGNYRVTVKGRLALLIRETVRHSVQIEQ
jgi:hypothetical protein